FDSTGYLNRLQVRGGGRGRFEPELANSEVDTVVLYKAAYIDYDIPGEVTHLDRDARVDYRGNGLEAGSIVVTWRENIMRAKPLYDTRPTLYQAGQDPMEGELMEFDLATEKGRVVQGRTRLDAGYYQGALIHRHPDNVFYVESSLYTTCSLEHPHFYFASKKMKMLQGDKVIARPIVLYIMDVPILGLPFAVFPNQPGRRRSGWIMPSYGDNRFSGQHLQGLGYFWAINDYIDMKSLVDFYSKKGIRSTSRLRYTRRGKFSGRVGLRLYRELVETNDIAHLFNPDKSKMPWSGSWNHSQNFDPTQRLSISGTYTSDPRLNRRFGRTLQDRLNQQIVSNASYSKQWRQSGGSLTLALQDRYDLQAEEKVQSVVPTVIGQRIVERTQVLPRLRFSRSNRAIAGNSQKWYSGISMQFSSALNNAQTIFWEAVVDSALNDSLVWTADRQKQSRAQAKHSLSISNSGKLFRYISISAGLSLQEDWAPSHFKAELDENGEFVREDNEIVFNLVEEFSPRHTGSLRISAQTNIYGLIPVNIGGLQAIRHTIKPSVSFSYAPDFSEKVLGVDLGYFQKDADDKKFDRFIGSTIGGTSRTEQKRLSLSLKNIFQGKRERDGKEDKFMILDWTMSSGYNFTAEQFKIAPIRSSFRSPVLQKLNLDIQMVHDFYEWDQDARKKIDKVLPFPRLAQMSATTSIRLSGKHLVPRSEGTTVDLDPDSLALADTLLEQVTEYGEITTNRSQQVVPTLAAGNLWEAKFGIRYRLQPALVKEVAQSFQLDSSIKLSIGGGWSVGYNARFDLLDQELVTHNVRLYRKIHCWEMRFNWTPGGPGQGYFLSINVIDSDLKDIKYESRGGRQSFFGRN
ncbi:MAG: LPS-assembly protein LptD, partial [Candidatus Marinimicrobia bacterium]|nr:LPS-assembly protein LptD [Candidatus Neomarinimicrobiota bacterium]